MLKLAAYTLCLVAGDALAVSARADDSAVLLRSFTRVAELRNASSSGQRITGQVHLEGVVLLADARGGRLVLQDNTGAALLHVEGSALRAQLGDRIRVDALAEIQSDRIRLLQGFEVDNDGLHPALEKSGEVALRAGRQPFRVDWFNLSGEQVLEVYWQGPDLPRQRIPASAISREVVDPATGRANWLRGADYRAYEGIWQTLPLFAALQPVKTGVADEIDCNLSTATNNAGLSFAGYLNVPREGRYTFFVNSDDGARLSLETQPPRWALLATNQLPAPRRLKFGQNLREDEDCFWAESEGRVAFVTDAGTELELEVVSVGGRLSVRVLDAGNVPRALLPGSRVRVAGVCQSAFTTDGDRLAGLFLVPGSQQIEFLEVSPTLWRSQPRIPIRSAVTNAALDTNTVVRVRGRAHTDSRNGSLILRDGSGQLQLEPAFSPAPAAGNRVEVLGRLSRNGTNAILQGAVCRVVANSTAGDGKETEATEVLPLLCTVEAVKKLSRDEAERGYPVKLRGVVTALMPTGFFFQDSTWSIYVNCSAWAQVGEYWEIEGTTYAQFAPNVQATRAERLGRGQLPSPLRPTWDQLINGSLDTQYIEVEGVVTSVEDGVVSFLTRAGRIQVVLFDTPATLLKCWMNARVRLRGCFMPERDEATQQLIMGKFYLANASVSVDEPAPSDPFATGLKSVADLLKFDPQAGALQRTRLEGLVIHERAGEVFLMSGTNGFRLMTQAPLELQPGIRLEAVGFPDLGGVSPVLRNAVVRRTGRSALPEPRRLTAETLWDVQNDSTLVRIESRLVGIRFSEAQQLLELQADARSFVAHLPTNSGALSQNLVGSWVEVTGAYAGRSGDHAVGREMDSFELLLNSLADVVVVERPSWWTAQRMLMALGLLAAVLLLAAAWIASLHKQVDSQTRALQEEIEDRKQAEADLAEKARRLRAEIEDRTRAEQEVERIHRQLLAASHQAGMAEVATSVLHNVGNVLNSVNVSVAVASDRLGKSHAASLTRLLAMLQEHAHDLGHFLAHDEKGRQVLTFLEALDDHLARERTEITAELESLRRNVEHINEIVAMQQSYAGVSGVNEKTQPAELLEDSLQMLASGYDSSQVQVVREYDNTPSITVDRHKALQILVNLLDNARRACEANAPANRSVTVRLSPTNQTKVRIEVADNGAGIAPENLTRIFNHGFTTRKGGHGFGLHSSILAAKELGGSLSAHSAGLGHGATFTLELPLQPPPLSHSHP